MTKLWVSKYALSKGLFEIEWNGETSPNGYVYEKDGVMFLSYKLGSDAHGTEAEAKEAAEKQRLRKIASLKKQLAKLEAMRF